MKIKLKKSLKGNFSKKKSKIKSPGMLKKHYSPGIPVMIKGKPSKSNEAYIVFWKKTQKC